MENKVKVICTSTGCIEYAPERYRHLGIGIIRIHFFFKGKEYLEGLDLDPDFVYKEMLNVKDTKNNLPHTAIPTYEDVAGQFRQAIADGYKEVIVIALSSYSRRDVELHPFGRQRFRDSSSRSNVDGCEDHLLPRRLSCGQSSRMGQCRYADGANLKEIEWIKARQEFFGIDAKLDYLIYNGRLKGGKAYLGKMMSICPVVHFSHDGELVPLTNVIGQTGALKKTCQILLKLIGNRDPKDYILYHVYTGPSPLR
jgi:fatty acid-binding protein DegV